MKYRNCGHFGSIVLTITIFLLCGTTLFAQYKGSPVKKDKLLSVLRSHQLQTREIVEVIKSNGVDFLITSPIEQELVSAGARPEVIVAAKANYRASAGPVKPAPAGNYDEMVDKAIVSKDNQVLLKAVKSNPNGARAYQQLGANYLLQGNYAEAEKYMRLAINLGGSGVFTVKHDHSSRTFSKYCTGTLFIAKDTVRFESDDNRHTFETSTTNVVKTEIKSSIVSGFTGIFLRWKPGTILFVLRSGEKDSVNYNFLPASENLLESQMIARLVGK
ncbi:MAG: tetratricopeptide repeat protein [Pyrinomonadaceae bacterium]